MKLTFIIITALIIVAITLLFVFGKYSQKGQAAGLVNASLTRCTTKPNCVCSEHIDDSEHYIEPVTHIQHADIKNMSKAISIIKQMNGTLQSVKKITLQRASVHRYLVLWMTLKSELIHSNG